MDLNEELRKACFEGNHTIIDELIGKGLNINYINEYNYSPLMAAINGRQINTVKYLIIKGCDVNAGQWTALHDVIDTTLDDMIQLNKEKPDETLLQIIRLLIDSGADVYKKDNKGRKPFDLFLNIVGSESNFTYLKNLFRSYINEIDKYVD